MDVAAFFLRVFLVTLWFFVVFGTEGEEGSPGGVCSRASLILNDGLVIGTLLVTKLKDLVNGASKSNR